MNPVPAYAAQAAEATNTGFNFGLYGLLFTAVAGAVTYLYTS